MPQRKTAVPRVQRPPLAAGAGAYRTRAHAHACGPRRGEACRVSRVTHARANVHGTVFAVTSHWLPDLEAVFQDAPATVPHGR